MIKENTIWAKNDTVFYGIASSSALTRLKLTAHTNKPTMYTQENSWRTHKKVHDVWGNKSTTCSLSYSRRAVIAVHDVQSLLRV